MARLTRLILCAVAIGAALVLLGACAQQKQPIAMPEGRGLAAGTMEPTRVAAPISAARLPPSVEPAGNLVAEPPIVTGSDPLAADLAIQVIPGETGLYTLTVRNFGPGPAISVVITDALPSGVTLLWTGPSQPVCGRQERGVGCDLGDLQPGDAATVTLDLSVGGTENLITGTQLAGVTLTLSVPVCAIEQVSGSPWVTCRLSRLQPGAEAQVCIGFAVDSPVVGVVAHTATVTGDGLDPDRSNNRATAAMTVTAVEPVVTPAVPTTADLILQADGPASVIAGRPFTYTYTITNHGATGVTGVWFEDVVPPDLNLVGYAPRPPRCDQQGDALTCTLLDPDGGGTVTFTLAITGHGEQPMLMGLDPVQPGWPICWVIKERTWLHLLQCELGKLGPGQAVRVQLALVAIGVTERTIVNTASVRANQAEQHPVPMGITSTVTITVQVEAEPDRP